MGWEKKHLHLRRFVVLSNELQNKKYGRSASGAERPILIPSTYKYIIGSVGVGWQRRCKTRQSMREPGNRRAVLFSLAAAMAGGRVRSFVRCGEP